MQASREVTEPAQPGRVLRAPMPRPWRPRTARRRLSSGDLASGILHLAVVAVLLLARPAAPPAEQEAAPSFAVNFVDSGVPTPSAAPPSPPEVNLGGAEVEAPPPPEDRPAEALPIPPPRRRYGSALRPRANQNPFANVVPFDLSQQSRHSLASSSIGRGLDLSAGPMVRDGRLQESVSHVMGSHGLADYMEALSDFVESHKYYPSAAVENGEQGSAELQVTITRDGHVKNMRLVSSSGSHLLDAAWMSVFRDNRLPEFNDDMPMKELTLPVTLNYELIYGHQGGGLR